MEPAQDARADHLRAVDDLEDRGDGEERHAKRDDIGIGRAVVEEQGHQRARQQPDDHRHQRHEAGAHRPGAPPGARDPGAVAAPEREPDANRRRLRHPPRHHERQRRDLQRDRMRRDRIGADQPHQISGGAEHPALEPHRQPDRKPEQPQPPVARPVGPRYRRLWLLGLPIGLAMGFEGGVFSAAAYLMGLISADAVAAHAVALQIAALSFMVPWGMAQAATVRVGLALGRGDRAGIARAGWSAWAMGTGFMALMAVSLAMPQSLMTLFLDDSAANANVIALGVSFLAVAAIFQVVDGAQVVGAGILRGLHDTRVQMIFTFVGYWAMGSARLWLAFRAGWGGVGIWTGLALRLAIVAVLMLGRWIRRERLGLLAQSSM